ncbi:MAG: hypothetical protein IIW36_01180 [Clostridia bacterium]|nr:hypothetical protein [Clostridia bacterium]MBQ5893043.1 hypothetical protein [Clostridia bacterium]
MGIKAFFKRAFSDMKESAKAQHEADRAELAAVRAESRAQFEENRGRNTYAKAKAEAKKTWDEAHESPFSHTAKVREANAQRAAAAKERIEAAEARIEESRKPLR